MRKGKQTSENRYWARKIIKLKFLSIGSLLSVALLYGLAHLTGPNRDHHLSSQHAIIFLAVAFGGMLLVKFLVIRFAFKNKLDVKYAIKSVQKQRKKNNERRQKADEYKRKHYFIQKVEINSSSFLMQLFFSDTIKAGLVPVLTLNGVELPTKALEGNSSVTIPTEKFITEAPDKFVFALGENEYVVKNPYLVKNPNSVVFWQCEGNMNERAIFITDFLAYPLESLGYQFTLYVGSQKIDVFTGSLVAPGVVRIPIGKSVNKSEIVGKQCTLRYAIGKVCKITLPAPTVLSRNGQPVS